MTAEPINVADFEEAARETLDPGAYGYFAGGAGDEWTLRENVEAFRRLVLRPRVLVDVGAISTEADVLGAPVALPVLVAPTAFQRLAHADGEPAAARAAARAGTVYSLSSLASVTPAELAAAAPEGRKWFQLYWSRDRGFTRELLVAAAGSGFEAVVFTVDFPAAGRRERDLRARFRLPPDLPVPNIPGRLEREDFHLELGEIVDPGLTWRDLEWYREHCPLPLLVKGVLTAEDALLAAEHGAAGVIVSNHGGRQLDGVTASIAALPEVGRGRRPTRRGDARRRRAPRRRRSGRACSRRARRARGPAGRVGPRRRRGGGRGSRARALAERGRARAEAAWLCLAGRRDACARGAVSASDLKGRARRRRIAQRHRKGAPMTFGIRTLLLLGAAILFLIAAISSATSTNWPHLLGWGLCLTALAFLVDELPIGSMRWGGNAGGPPQQRPPAG